MAFLCYMPIVSASFTTLMCSDTPVDGTYWLEADLAVQCYVGQHAVASVLAVVVLIMFGLGTPAQVLWVLGRATPSMLRDAAFSNAYAFLYEGYARAAEVKARASIALDTPADATDALHHARTARNSCAANFWRALSRSLVWWEAVVMLRKAAVIMLATIVTNQFYQVVGAVLLFGGAVAVQQHFNPYARPLFNHLELVSLLDLYITAAVSTMMLPATAAPRNVVRQPAAWEKGLTASLVVMNIVTKLVLAATLVLTVLAFAARSTAALRSARGGKLFALPLLRTPAATATAEHTPRSTTLAAGVSGAPRSSMAHLLQPYATQPMTA